MYLLLTWKSLISWWLLKEDTGKQWGIQPAKKWKQSLGRAEEQHLAEAPCRRVQRVTMLEFSPGSQFHTEGFCKERPRNTSFHVSSQSWGQWPFVPVPWIPAPQSELLYAALGTAGSRCLTFLLGLQLQAQSHEEAVHCWSDTFKTPSEPSAVEKFLHGTAISEIPSPVLTEWVPSSAPVSGSRV